MNIFEIFNLKCPLNKVVYESLTKEKFDEKFNRVLNCLKPQYQTIIINSYVKKDNIWWVDRYSKSSYYRFRSRAYQAFIILFEVSK